MGASRSTGEQMGNLVPGWDSIFFNSISIPFKKCKNVTLGMSVSPKP